MKLYLLLSIAFLLQEPISTDALLLEVYQYHYNIWIVHGLFIVATIIDAIFFYYLGLLIHKKYSQSRIVIYAKHKAEFFTNFAGKNGKRAALFFGGFIIFPISAFIAPWIEISFWESLIFLFLGDLIFWYGGEWLVVLGVKSFIPNPKLALYATVVIASIAVFGIKYLKKRSFKND